jgi:hypothetical protein
MATNPEQRIGRWNEKFSTERTKQSLDAQLAAMRERYAHAVTALCAMEQLVRQVLNEAAVQTVHYVWYLDYARQLWKLSRKKDINAGSFALAAQVLERKWASRDLRPDVLARIRTEVFGTGAP